MKFLMLFAFFGCFVMIKSESLLGKHDDPYDAKDESTGDEAIDGNEAEYQGAAVNKRASDVEPVKKWRNDKRCGSKFPLANGEPTQCNPNGLYCCSVWGWCGKSDKHCFCEGCVSYGKKWRNDKRCGSQFPLANGKPSQCNPNGLYCCSVWGWCGKSDHDCFCEECVSYERNCDSSWKAFDHKEDDPKTCKVYEQNQYCNKNGTQGPGWNSGEWGDISRWTDSYGRSALVCPECGCKECLSSWKAHNHKRKNKKTCKRYSDEKWCENGTYGSLWSWSWGEFSDWDDGQGYTALNCPECGACKIAVKKRYCQNSPEPGFTCDSKTALFYGLSATNPEEPLSGTTVQKKWCIRQCSWASKKVCYLYLGSASSPKFFERKSINHCLQALNWEENYQRRKIHCKCMDGINN